MLVVDNQGIPLGALVASAQRAEITLAEATLATARVPRVRGRPRSRPRELVAGASATHCQSRGVGLNTVCFGPAETTLEELARVAGTTLGDRGVL